VFRIVALGFADLCFAAFGAGFGGKPNTGIKTLLRVSKYGFVL